jgi:hypothetical protein
MILTTLYLVGAKSTNMRAATLYHAWVVGELSALRAAVSFTSKLVLGCSRGETTRVEVMTELAANFGG